MEGFNLANITDAYVGDTQVSAIYKGSTSVWELPPAGHAYVDLGLPSGTLWATMNVGATSETDYGNYYMYGKITPYNSSDSIYTGTEDPLSSSADVATQEWGSEWHMPTKAQFNELINNTTYKWATINNIKGGKFTATNGNYVFFPAADVWNNNSLSDSSAGFYWSSNPSNNGAYYLVFSKINLLINFGNRLRGLSIRPVKDAPLS